MKITKVSPLQKKSCLLAIVAGSLLIVKAGGSLESSGKKSLTGSVETITASGLNASDNLYVENELIINKILPGVPYLTLGLENLFSYQDGQSQNELTSGLILGPSVNHYSGLSLKVFSASEASLGIDLLFGFTKEFEKMDFAVMDENEILYHFNDNLWEYVNTLELLKGINKKGRFETGVYLENEFVFLVSETVTTALQVGPVFIINPLTLGLYYTHDYAADVNSLRAYSDSHQPGIATTVILDL